MRRTCYRGLAAAWFLLPVAVNASIAASVPTAAPGVIAKASAVAVGQRLRIDNLPFSNNTVAALELRRFEVFTPNAVLFVDGEARVVPQTTYFRGSIAGDPRSSALVIVRENGAVSGLVFRDNEKFALVHDRRASGLRARAFNLAADVRPFTCGADQLVRQPATFARADPGASWQSSSAPDTTATTYTARVAVETDFEYYQLFAGLSDDPSVVEAAAIDYIGDLIAYASLTFEREVGTTLEIPFLRLWTDGAESDPWTETTTEPVLYQLKDFWQQNMTHITRTSTYLVSGKALAGATGIAFEQGLCNEWAYGLSSYVQGDFNWDRDPTHDPAAFVADIYLLAHELGHNFGSPHTHEYCSIGGSDEPVDRCASGCAGPALGMPTCDAPPTAFGGGAGTIMSYCGHFNDAMTFGRDHPCGTLPDRVPEVMRNYVVQQAIASPNCLIVDSECGNGICEPTGETDSNCAVDCGCAAIPETCSENEVAIAPSGCECGVICACPECEANCCVDACESWGNCEPEPSTTTTTATVSTTTSSTTSTLISTTTTTLSATTTTVPPTTSTLRSTTTTTLQSPSCSQPVSFGPSPIASDCLYILNAAVGIVACDPECICAPKGDLPIAATDALVCLTAAVGVPVELDCRCS